jgi:hypothetical protein
MISAVRTYLLRSPPEPAHGVRGGQQEAGDEVGGDVHVGELRPQVRVGEQRLDRLDVDDLAVRAQPEAGRVLHPRIDRDHHQ